MTDNGKWPWLSRDRSGEEQAISRRFAKSCTRQPQDRTGEWGDQAPPSDYLAWGNLKALGEAEDSTGIEEW